MLQFELFCYFQTCHHVLEACLHIPQFIFFKHFPECLVFVFFVSYHHPLVPAGHPEDHPCVRGPG